MEEYLKLLTEQVRCVKAREAIKDEYKKHIIDQAGMYEEDGMEHDEAIRLAVKEMGDPVQAGVELDHIHRPQMDWKMLIAVIVLNVLGVLMQCYMNPDISITRQLVFVGIGSIVMIGMYFIDYSILAKHIEIIYVFYFIAMFLAEFVLSSVHFDFFINTNVNGYYSVIRLLYLPSYIFIFIYAGVMYKHRGEEILGIVKSGLSAIPMFLYLLYGSGSLVVILNLLVILIAMSIFAICKGWFNVSKVAGISLVVGVGIIFPIIASIFYVNTFALDYQVHRLRAFFYFYRANDGLTGSGYVYNYLQELMKNATLLPNDNSVMVPDGYILAQIMSSYGILILLSVVAIIFGVIVKVFDTSFKQRNQLGMMLGFGFGVMLVTMIVKAILMNAALYPGTTIMLPFLTYGGEAIIGYSFFFGVLLSVYRYKNVYTDNSIKSSRKYKLKISLEKQN